MAPANISVGTGGSCLSCDFMQQPPYVREPLVSFNSKFLPSLHLLFHSGACVSLVTLSLCWLHPFFVRAKKCCFVFVLGLFDFKLVHTNGLVHHSISSMHANTHICIMSLILLVLGLKCCNNSIFFFSNSWTLTPSMVSCRRQLYECV